MNSDAIREYVENKGEVCPECKQESAIIDTKIGVSVLIGSIEVPMKCFYKECGEQWIDIYNLVSIKV